MAFGVFVLTGVFYFVAVLFERVVSMCVLSF